MATETPELGPDPDEDLPDEVIDRIETGTPVLQAVREWRDLSVWELAIIAEVPERTIEAEEAGTVGASFEDTQALARALEVDTALLLQ